MLTYADISDPVVTEYIAQFDCNDEPDVEEYLKKRALLHHSQRTTFTRLFFNESGELVGYYTVLTDLVEIGKGKRVEHNWDLDEKIQRYPAIKIHYIGVDSRFRRQGYGSQILGFAQVFCIELSKSLGFNFVTAEVKNKEKRIGWFKKRGFDYCSRKIKTCLRRNGTLVNMASHIVDIEHYIATQSVSA